MILGIQLLGILFALFMIYLTSLYQKRKEFDAKEAAFWIILWTIVILVTLLPDLLNPITATLQLGRTMDLFIILGFMLVMGVAFHNYLSLRKTQRKVETIVRKLAINERK